MPYRSRFPGWCWIGVLSILKLVAGCQILIVVLSVLDAPAKLGKILRGMNRALGEIPLTIKVRTGVKDGKNTAHKLLPDLQSWGASSFAVR